MNVVCLLNMVVQLLMLFFTLQDMRIIRLYYSSSRVVVSPYSHILEAAIYISKGNSTPPLSPSSKTVVKIPPTDNHLADVTVGLGLRS